MSVILDSPIPEHFFAINNETNESTLFIFIFPGGVQIQEEPLDLSIQTRHEENSPDNRQPYNKEYVTNEENQHFSRNPNSPAYSSEVRSKSLSLNSINLRPHSSAMKKPMVVFHVPPTYFDDQINNTISSVNRDTYRNINASTASTSVIHPFSLSKKCETGTRIEL